MQVVVLAAGAGRRMRPTTVDTPKCLLRAGGETLLSRMLRQFAEYPDVVDIVLVTGHSADRLAAATLAAPGPVRVVLNHEFASDDNLRSMERGFAAVDRTRATIFLASDLWLDDGAVRAIIEAGRADANTILTSGAFDPGDSGCAVHHDSRGRVDEIRVAVDWHPGLASHRSALGAAVVCSRDAERFAGLLTDARHREDTRYEVPWSRCLNQIETRCVDLQSHRTASVDTAAQYEALCESLRTSSAEATEVRLVPIEWLRPIEQALPERVTALGQRIDAEAIWHRALVVDRRHFMVLDGTHRLEAAHERGFRFLPVVMVDYDKVGVWALPPGETVMRDHIVERALAGDLFPAGWVKHQLPLLDINCRFVLARLAA